MLLHNPLPRARVFGFKEIYTPFVRDPTATDQVLTHGVGFVRTLFPKARFVFHTRRNLTRAADSDFWQRDWHGAPPDRAERLQRITHATSLYRAYARAHPDHAIVTTLEGLTDRADSTGELAALFKFLGESLSTKLKKLARSHQPLHDWAEERHTRRITVRAANGTVLGVERRSYKYTDGAAKATKRPKKKAKSKSRRCDDLICVEE